MKRFEIIIKFTGDLDSVPGWGHEPQDWVDLITQQFRRQTHYRTSADVQAVRIFSDTKAPA